ncbi:hypothetical protein [Paenibacillus barengoltzii]|uniref:hypothetical protein n=1 Tax=Paenibacillus barengoltzii TaxID=343517 RepID=UPI000A055158|nr:hypothetical protein [Paenibacillus barengoltzii]MEC2345871.1 hypothetical protein [Paenibacillus barengoltzii]
MRSLLKKSFATLGLTACLVGAISSAASASISWDSWATWTGVGAIASVNAYTAQQNEPYTYKLTVEARLNNGDSSYNVLNNARATDRVDLYFTSTGPVSSGVSYHEWITVDGGSPISKSIRFQ